VAQQFINSADGFVAEALEGFERAHAGLVRWNRSPSFVVRATPAPPGKVVLVSGGGSGHEPLHTGYVGTGMLDAAVPGAVFSSPSAVQVAAAADAVAGPAGVLFIVKNYTGDVLNFALAADMAGRKGATVETVLVDDDVATDTGEGGPGRRGTAAVLVVEKVCGALAEQGASLGQVAAVGRRIVASGRSMSVALSGSTHPGHVHPSFELPVGQIELGVGIHGEPGRERRALASAHELAGLLVEPLVTALGLGRGDSTILVVNGLGGTTGLELGVMFREVAALLDAAGISIERSLLGPYLTSLDMAGCSITLVRSDPELLALWDAPVRTPALTW
jgi:dihydroxyacetone kinase-like protein